MKEIANQIANLTVLEAKKLVDILKDEYGLKPYIQKPTLSIPSDSQEKEEQTEFDVILVSIGDASKLMLVKLVKELTSLGLRESKNLVESAPIEVKKMISSIEANDIVSRFKELGAEMKIK